MPHGSGSMNDFVRAAEDVIHQLQREGLERRKAVIYCHPNTLADSKKELNHMAIHADDSGNDRVHGVLIETDSSIPEGIVCGIHLEAMRMGTAAIQFASIADEE